MKRFLLSLVLTFCVGAAAADVVKTINPEKAPEKKSEIPNPEKTPEERNPEKAKLLVVTEKKGSDIPLWTPAELTYAKEISRRLEALPKGDSRKLMLGYLKFLADPTRDRAEDFSKEVLRTREEAKKPISGTGFFVGDPYLCQNQKGDCGYSIGRLTDRHLVPLLKKGDTAAIEVALSNFLVGSQNGLERLSYFAAFRVPKVVTKHPREIVSVLYKMRNVLATLNPGPTCFYFRFFDKKVDPNLIKKELSSKQADELINVCQDKVAKLR